MPAPSGTFGHPSSDQQVVEYINSAVQTGQMAPGVALQILRDLAKSGGDMNAGQVMRNIATFAGQSNGALAPPPAQPLPAPRPAAATFVTAPAHIEQWILDARLTLKDNLDDWARTAGWNAPVWMASNYYQVTRSAVLNGSFTEALKIVTDNTGLNICATSAQKLVRVTDPNVPCAK
jgi:hypothetical protein